MRKEVEEAFSLEQLKRISTLANLSSKVSLTLDAWTSRNQLPFLGITMHYFDEKWELVSDLLAFEYLPGSHTGEHLASCVFDYRKYVV
jgi:hypothetical protein